MDLVKITKKSPLLCHRPITADKERSGRVFNALILFHRRKETKME